MKVVPTILGSLACMSMVSAGDKTVNTQVLIVGAGSAGIAAAEELHMKGIDFVVLDAEDRVGGRVKSVKWDDVTVEVGASWVPGASTNEFWPKVEHLQGGMVDNAYVYLVDYDGRDREEVDPDVSTPIREQFNDAFEACVELAVSNHDKVLANPKKFDDLDMSVGDCLDDQGFPEDDDSTQEGRVAMAMKYSGVDLRFGTDAYDVSLLGSYTEMDMGLSPRRYMVTDINGFDSFLDKMARPFMDKVHLNKKVVTLDQESSEDEVCAITESGKRYCADYAISTLPLSTFQDRTVDFKPKLSHDKMSSIYEMKVAPLAKVCVQFDDKFWSTEVLMMAEEDIGEYSWAISIDEPKYAPDSATLCFHLTGDVARRVEKQGHKATRNDVEKWIDHMFPNIDPRPEILNVAASDWSANPNFGGAISVWPDSLTPEEHSDLGKREGRIFFGGEHTHADFHGTITGGLLSGKTIGAELATIVPAGGNNYAGGSSSDDGTPLGITLLWAAFVGMISGGVAAIAITMYNRSKDQAAAREPLLGSVYPSPGGVFAGANPYFAGIRDSISGKFSSPQGPPPDQPAQQQ